LSSTYIDELFEKLKSAASVKVIVKIFGDGERKILEIRFSSADKDEKLLICACRDITEIFENEESLKRSENSFLRIVENSDELICKTDANGNLIYANNGFLSKFGFTKEEIKSLNIFNLISTKVTDEQLTAISKFPNQPLHHTQLKFTSKNGQTFSALTTLIPRSEKENEKSFYCYLTDISEVKTYQQDFQIFRSAFEAAKDGIAVELEGKIILVNNAFASIFGYTGNDDLEGKEMLDLVSNNDVLKVAEYLRLREGKKPAPDRFEFLGKKKDNTNFHAEISVSTFDANDSVYLILLARDITERKRTQAAIRESEEKYRNLTDNIDDFLYTFEKVGKYLRPVFYTSAVEKVTGYSQTEFLSDSKLFLKIIHPDDLQELKDKIGTLLKSKVQSSIELEFRIINKHGNIAWVRNKINLNRNPDGSIYKLYGLVSDITVKKRTEEELKQLAESLKKINETKDRFISIVSHDLRTPFSSILGFTDLLTNDDTLTEDERRQYVKYIQESSKMMLSLVN
ncbi:MAG TPA: PAS domain S-box protein, partial [Ignavibacteriaceae bacterium]